MKDVTSSVAKSESASTVRNDSVLIRSGLAESQAFSKSIAQDKLESGVSSRSNVIRGSGLNEKLMKKPGDTIASEVKGKMAARAETDSGSLDKISITMGDLKAQLPAYTRDGEKITAAKPSSASIADNKYDDRDQAIAKKKSFITMKKRRSAKNIIVRRGNMKDLPDTLRMADPLVIQTKLERTPKGMLLTFYSSAIKDTSATFVEAVTADSIIVFFHSKQIAYRIPGGLTGGV
jgi:hypothetical protein